MLKLKVCGMRPDDDLAFTGHPVMSHIGILFVPTSKRYVPPEEAAVWLQEQRPACRVAGVFVNAPAQTVRDVAMAAGLHTVQLHGDEPPADCAWLKAQGYTVWKAISVPAGATAETLYTKAVPFVGCVDGLLLDAAPPKGAKTGVTGGHGISFDWRLVPEWLGMMRTLPASPALFVAGGFTPENIQRFAAICAGRSWPDGIDVSSGVEQDGRKSQTRIQQMMRVVNQLGKDQ